MIRLLLPLLLALLGGLVMWHLSTRALARQLSANSTRLTDPRLAPVLARLARALDLPEVPVYLYRIAPINGLAAPDGRVFLTQGFLAALDAGRVTPEELASVIAHELGHVAHGHSRRRMIDFSGQNALRFVLGTLLARALPGVGPWLAGLVTSALAARLSQRDEFEADAFATALLIKAGIGAAPQISLFAKLDALTGGARGATPAWLLSHPATPRRIAAIEANAARWR